MVLALMGATALVLLHMKSHQRLGEPGIRTRPVAGSKKVQLMVPETVPGYTCETLTNAQDALQALPEDTSYRVLGYKGTNGFWAEMSVVLMGSDRSSIHKPQICMTGQGWTQDNNASCVDQIHLTRPVPYNLPVNKLVFTKQVQNKDGEAQTVRGLYVYWYVDGNRITANENKWMLWWMPRDLLLHGVLERWAYIAFFSPCLPGQEDATYERMKQLIAATVPQFQLVPRGSK